MTAKRVVVTVDRQLVPDIDDEVERLKRDGLEVVQLLNTNNVSHVVGRYDGDLAKLNRNGVVAEWEGWMTAQ